METGSWPWWSLPLVSGVLAFFTAMVGVSGAFLLLPFQLSVLGIVSPSASATNLVFNLFAIPTGIWQYGRAGRIHWRLALTITAASVPGLFAGWGLRVSWLAERHRFEVFVGAVLAYLALRLFLGRKKKTERIADRHPAFPVLPLGIASMLIGIVGGAYGIGGGALMAPLLVAVFHLPFAAIAGATLFSTWATSVVGIVLYQCLPAPNGLVTQPDWGLGLLFGIGGACGMALGARMQRHVPERALELGLAILLSAVAAKYLGVLGS